MAHSETDQLMGSRSLLDELTGNAESPYCRYLRIFVGDTSVSAFVRYEIVTALFGPMSGALGYFMRSRCFPWILGRVGRGAMFGSNMVLRCPKRITIGGNVVIDDHVVLDAKGESSQIVLGDQIFIGRHSILSCNEAAIQIGDRASIGPFCVFAAKGPIRIGANVSIGPGSMFMAGTHASDDPDVAVSQQARIAKGITIQDNVWIGTGAKILDGVIVGRNSIVGAEAVVNRDVPAWTVVLGNPARVIQKRKTVAETT